MSGSIQGFLMASQHIPSTKVLQEIADLESGLMKTHWFLCFGRPLNTYHPPEISHVREPAKCDRWKTNQITFQFGDRLGLCTSGYLYIRCINFREGPVFLAVFRYRLTSPSFSANRQPLQPFWGCFQPIGSRKQQGERGGVSLGVITETTQLWIFLKWRKILKVGEFGEFGEFGVGLGLLLDLMMMMMMMMMFYW